MPETPARVLGLIRDISPARVWGEEVHTMGNEGRNSLETFIRPIGIIEGICLTLGIPMFYVRPQTWFEWYGYRSKHFETKLLWKKFLVDEANKFYPSQYATKFTADAILLWNYAVNHLDEQKKLPKLKIK